MNVRRYFIMMIGILWVVASMELFPAHFAVTIGGELEPASIDPPQYWDSSYTDFSYNIYDTLVTLNPVNNQLEPSLAISWEIKENGVLWVFKLREGVKFHDGSDFNADSVVFSFIRQMDPNFKYRYYDFPTFKDIFPTLKEVKRIDNRTVSFRLTRPFYPFLASLASGFGMIVSPDAVKKYGKDFPSHPVGTGPFKLKSWWKGKKIILEKNPLYWNTIKPDIDEINAIFGYSSEYYQQLFQQQKLDFLLTLSLSKIVGLRSQPWVGKKRTLLNSTAYVAFNFKNKLLKKKNIRKTLLMMWDPNWASYIYQNFNESAYSFIPPQMQGYCPENKSVFSIQNALACIKKETIPSQTVFNCLTIETNDFDSQFLTLFAKNLMKAGIKLKIHRYPIEQYQKQMASGNYDLTIAIWGADYPDTHSFLFPLFSKTLSDPAANTFSGYEERNLLQEINIAASTSNAAMRNEMYKKIDKWIMDEALCIPIYFESLTFLYNKSRIQDVYVNSLGVINFLKIRKK